MSYFDSISNRVNLCKSADTCLQKLCVTTGKGAANNFIFKKGAMQKKRGGGGPLIWYMMSGSSFIIFGNLWWEKKKKKTGKETKTRSIFKLGPITSTIKHQKNNEILNQWIVKEG